MTEWIKDLMSYPGIAFLMFLENIFPPLPSELIMPMAGYRASQGEISLWGAILAGTIGSLVGQMPLYYLGKIIGYERVREWADKHGAWLTVSPRDIDKAKDWFDKHGNGAVFYCRVIPGIRSLISIPAGFAHMNLGKFLLYSLFGKAIWTAILAYLGKMLGDNYGQVDKYLGPVTWLVLGGIAVGIIVAVIKRKKEGHGQEHAGQEAADAG